MSGSLRLGILLVIVLLAWVIIYYRLVAPALVEPEPPVGLALQSGDTVSTEPETNGKANDVESPPQTISDSGKQTGDSVDPPSTPDSNANGNDDPNATADSGNDGEDGINDETSAADSNDSGGESDEDDDEVVLPKPPPTTPYIVKSGDTMESIAESWFGSKSKWLLISWENPFADPRKLEAGITLRLPPKDARVESIPRELYEELTREIRYVLSSGDTLSDIAKRFYGKPALYTLIAEANRDIIENPDVLQAGIEIIIPRYQQPAE